VPFTEQPSPAVQKKILVLTPRPLCVDAKSFEGNMLAARGPQCVSEGHRCRSTKATSRVRSSASALLEQASKFGKVNRQLVANSDDKRRVLDRLAG
jgi:hypothetical protein